ncbi:MAG: hypothetical protein IJH12_02740 [Clostridia bacterium]|nr:hypothetical protein [Clostridia bacterium]
MKLDDNIKKKMNFLQKLKNNNIVDERQVVSINYIDGKKLKLNAEEDIFLLQLSECIKNKQSILRFLLEEQKGHEDERNN